MIVGRQFIACLGLIDDLSPIGTIEKGVSYGKYPLKIKDQRLKIGIFYF